MKNLKWLAAFLIVATLFGGILGCKQEPEIKYVFVEKEGDTVVPADVTELTATNKDASVLLTWTDATDEDIYGYEVTWNKNAQINRSAAMEANSMMVAPGAKGCYISNLTNGTEYTFTVKSVDTSGNKSAGVTKTITPSIIEKSPLQIVIEPNTTEKTNQDVVITVNATTDSASKIKQIAYKYGTVVDIDTVLAGTNILYAKKIRATENDTFTVAVTDTAGRRELAFITVDNIDKTAPAQVADVMPSYSKNNNEITLSWTNPTDEDFAGTEIVYGKTDSEETTTRTFDKDTTSATIENIAEDDSEYTIAIKTKDDVGNLSEAKTVTVFATAIKITSVSIPVAGTNYAGKLLPVTINGKNFMTLGVEASGFTSTDPSFNNVTIISNTKATAEVACPNAVGTTNVTVSYGESSATTTLKVIESVASSYEVGDIILTDGTKVSVNDVATYTIDENNKPIGVAMISDVYGVPTPKVIGLQKSASGLSWARCETGYSTKFTNIVCKQSQSGVGAALTATFKGDIDGSDNWEEICAADPEGTQDSATNYPAFYFANTYGTTAELTDTDYENGWYVPSLAELCEVYKNKDVIQTSLTKAIGFTIVSNHSTRCWYWSSSQSAFYDDCTCIVYFNDGSFSNGLRYVECDVFVLHALTAE